MQILLKKIRLVVVLSAVFLLCIPHAVFAVEEPAATTPLITDFMSDSEIELIDPNACPPGQAGSSSGGSCCAPGASGGALSGNDNEQKVFNFFVSKGLTKVQAAGIVGNFSAESGFDPFQQEGGQTAPNGGMGIAQWTGTGRPGDPAGDRRLKMIKALKSKGIEVNLALQTINKGQDEDTVLSLQLDYAWEEATARGDIAEMKKATTVDQAVVTWLEKFEIAGIEHRENRLAAGNAAKEKYGGGGGTVSTSSTPPTGTASGSCCASATATSGAVSDGSPSDWVKMYTGANKSKVATMAKGDLSNPKILVIHYTVGSQEGQDLLNFFTGTSEGTGIQFNVGKTGKIYQYFPLNDMKKTYHVGQANSKAIGIEITGKDVNELLANDAQFEAVASLAKALCDKYSISCGDAKGDMTNTGLADAQGMLGHDETPTNDHTDPDAKYGQDVDRKDSSKHPYMKKLREKLGFPATPGAGGASGGGGGGNTATPTANSDCASGDSVGGNGTAKDPVGEGANRGLGIEAVKYDTETNNNKYTYLWGGLHGPVSQLEEFSKNGGGVDCSGFIRYIIWRVYGNDIGSIIDTGFASHPDFKEVAAKDVEAGDVAWRPGHVDFITENKGGGKLHQFGAHSTENDLYGGDTDATDYEKFFRYIGPKGAGGGD